MKRIMLPHLSAIRVNVFILKPSSLLLVSIRSSVIVFYEFGLGVGDDFGDSDLGLCLVGGV